MKHKRWSVLGFAILVFMSLLLPAGVASAAMSTSSRPTGRHAVMPSAWPAKYFAPYASSDQIIQTAQQTGTKYFTLAFIISSGCQASWDGSTKVDGSATDATMMAINQLRSMGGDVAISFGGAGGQELALVCTDVGSLQQQYQNVIDAYHLTHLDFDVEGGAIADTASVMRRNQALAALQKANPNLVISFTLPVSPTGLTGDGINLLRDALQKGVKVSIVNIMTMDYGQPSSQMGAMAISATQATEKQLASINMSAKIGITPMIGQNDSPGEIFSLDDARNLVKFANQDSNVAELSMWSIGRDQPCSGGQGGPASSDCSSISQQHYDFTKIFGQFSGGQLPPPVPSWSFPCSDITSPTGHGSRPSEQIISKDWLSGNVASDTSEKATSQGGHFLFTYTADTYSLPQIHTFFSYTEGLAFLLITPSIILLGYQIILGASSFRHAGALEGFTRVLLGILAVATSFELIQMLIQLEGTMTKAILLLHAQYPFPKVTVNRIPVVYTLPGEPASSYRAIVVPMSRWGCALNDFVDVFSVSFVEDTVASVIPLFGGLAHLAGHTITIIDLIHDGGEMALTMLSILLWGQVFLRILLINYYILIAPLVFGCWALPGEAGQNVLRLWCKGFLTVLFIQVIQLFIATTLPILLPTLPQIIADRTGILQNLLAQFPPILTLYFMLITPRLLGASMSKVLGIAGSVAGGSIAAVGTAASL